MYIFIVYFWGQMKLLIHIFMCWTLLLNSMVYSVIQGSYELNKAYIIENFCVNKDKPMMNCDGKCFLAGKLKAQKEKQDANSTHKFTADFGVYIPVFPWKLVDIWHSNVVLSHFSSYNDPFTFKLIREVIKPPKI